MLRTSGFLVAVIFAAYSIAACGGSDKPPLTPDDTSAQMPDAGDIATPPADPNAAAPAAPSTPTK